eukprot:TRINITY_DN4783_c0_g1_i1.p1 TRINITY_DN4783_c0_g1~~TRINITY_DN4783_c0_g1_i1.p1  ORF type:complete len:987 (-),score=161.41 TRINITY_DN4783_c0_g1_i1:172-2880(-)
MKDESVFQRVSNVINNNLSNFFYNPEKDEIWLISSSLTSNPVVGRFSPLALVQLTAINSTRSVPDVKGNIIALAQTKEFVYAINNQKPFYLLQFDLINDINDIIFDKKELVMGAGDSPTTLAIHVISAENVTLIIGTSKGAQISINVEGGNLTSAHVSPPFKVWETSESEAEPDTFIAFTFVDDKRGWIYHIMGGSPYGAKEPTLAAVKRFRIDNSEISQNLEVPEDLYSVVSAAMDKETGILFLGASSSLPGKIVQISLVNPEFAIEAILEDVHVQTVSAASIFIPRFQSYPPSLFFSWQSTVKLPILGSFKPPMACGGMNDIECSGNGICLERKCTCTENDPPFLEPYCAFMLCEDNCSGNGICNPETGKCDCPITWGGDLCEKQQCPNECSGHGVCNTTTFQCQCQEGWGGSLGDCSVSLIPFKPCQERTTCSECLDSQSVCGWCEGVGDYEGNEGEGNEGNEWNEGNEGKRGKGGICSWGSADGPFFRETDQKVTCRNWWFTECPNPMIFVLNWTLFGIIMFFWSLNIFSAVKEDLHLQVSPESEWFRFIRSSKVHLIIYQIQYMASFAFMNISFPSLWHAFLRFWASFLLAAPLPFYKPSIWIPKTNPNLENNLERRNLDAYLAYSIVDNGHEFFKTTTMWLAFFMTCGLVFFLLTFPLQIIFRSNNWRRLIGGRTAYLIFRILDLSYMGIVVLSTLYMSAFTGSGYQDDTQSHWFALSIVFWLFFGVCYPLIPIIYINQVNAAKMIMNDDQFKVQWQLFYGLYKPDKLHFAWFSFLPRLLIGSTIGWSYKISPVAPLVVLVVVSLASILFVWKFDPYADYLHKYCVWITCAANALSGLLVFYFVMPSQKPTADFALFITFILMQFGSMASCIVIYIILVFQRNNLVTRIKHFFGIN